MKSGGVRENSNTSSSPSDSFGVRGSMFPSIFGGRDPFDDPFFTRPFGSLFGSNVFSSSEPANLQRASRSKQPVIEELDSDSEVAGEEECDVADAASSNRNPLVEHPEDQAKDHGKVDNSNRREVFHATHNNKVEVTQPETRSVSFQRVTCGGINGAYYAAITSCRTGTDGVTLEESKQADRTSGQATHRISRGIHDKGHSITRKLDSDGKVDTMQTLHNLNEDELVGFEQAWKGNLDRHLQGWDDTFDFPRNSGNIGTRDGPLAAWRGFSGPFREHPGRNAARNFNHNFQAQSSQGRPKKVVTINIE